MITISVYTSKYAEVYYNPDEKLLLMNWKIATEEMTDKEYRQTVSTLNNLLIKENSDKSYQFQKYLLDNRFFLYVIPEETQVWQRDHIFSRLINMGGEKIAIVMSEGYVSQHFIEQTIQESQEINLITQYFHDPVQAQNWLLS